MTSIGLAIFFFFCHTRFLWFKKYQGDVIFVTRPLFIIQKTQVMNVKPTTSSRNCHAHHRSSILALKRLLLKHLPFDAYFSNLPSLPVDVHQRHTVTKVRLALGSIIGRRQNHRARCVHVEASYRCHPEQGGESRINNLRRVTAAVSRARSLATPYHLY